MFKENQSALFIRLLGEAYEDDRLARRRYLSSRYKASTERFRRRQHAVFKEFLHAFEPLDCIQQMAK